MCSGPPVIISHRIEPKFADMPKDKQKLFVKALHKTVNKVDKATIRDRDCFIHPKPLDQKLKILHLTKIGMWDIECSVTASEKENRREVIFNVDVSLTREEILDEISDHRVVDVRRHTTYMDGKETVSGVVVLHFNYTPIHNYVHIGFYE